MLDVRCSMLDIGRPLALLPQSDPCFLISQPSAAARPTPAWTRLRSRIAAPAQALARISQVNAGIIRKDLARIGEARAALKQLSCEKLIGICTRAADFFLNDTLPLGDQGHTQSPQPVHRDALRHERPAVRHGPAQHAEDRTGSQQHADGAGWPDTRPGPRHPGSRAGRARRHAGQLLSRCAMPRAGHAEQFARGELALAAGHSAEDAGDPEAGARGALDALPPDPGVDRRGLPGGGVWLLSRPITKARPSILRGCGRALVFGDQSTTAPYANNPAIQVHGPGFSKILIGEDDIEQLAGVRRPDGLLHCRQWGPQLHQRLGGGRAQIRRRDRRGARARARPGRAVAREG